MVSRACVARYHFRRVSQVLTRKTNAVAAGSHANARSHFICVVVLVATTAGKSALPRLNDEGVTGVPSPHHWKVPEAHGRREGAGDLDHIRRPLKLEVSPRCSAAIAVL